MTGDRLVGFCFGGYPFIVHHDLAMEYLLSYLLPEAVADTADKPSLREVGDFGGRYQESSWVLILAEVLQGSYYWICAVGALSQTFVERFSQPDHLPGKRYFQLCPDHPRLPITVVTY